MQQVKCPECGAMVEGPDGHFMVRHVAADKHDAVRFSPPRVLAEVFSDELPAGDTVRSVEDSELIKTLPTFQETIGAVALVRANVMGRLDQLEVQVSGVIVRDLASLMLRVSEVEAVMGKFDGPLLFDLRGRVESLERSEIRRDAASFADLEHRLAALEQVLKLRPEIEG